MTTTVECTYHDLMRSIDYYNGAEWSWEPVEQCPNPATHYVELYQEGVHHGVTHLHNLCALHEELVRRMPGWVSSQRKQVVPA